MGASSVSEQGGRCTHCHHPSTACNIKNRGTGKDLVPLDSQGEAGLVLCKAPPQRRSLTVLHPSPPASLSTALGSIVSGRSSTSPAWGIGRRPHGTHSEHAAWSVAGGDGECSHEGDGGAYESTLKIGYPKGFFVFFSPNQRQNITT